MRSDPSRTLGCYGAFLDALTFARAPLVRRDTLLVEPPTQLPRTIHLRPAGRRALAASQPALGVSRGPPFSRLGNGPSDARGFAVGTAPQRDREPREPERVDEE